MTTFRIYRLSTTSTMFGKETEAAGHHIGAFADPNRGGRGWNWGDTPPSQQMLEGFDLVGEITIPLSVPVTPNGNWYGESLAKSGALDDIPNLRDAVQGTLYGGVPDINPRAAYPWVPVPKRGGFGIVDATYKPGSGREAENAVFVLVPQRG